MNKWKFIYGIILLIAIIAFFMPWVIGDNGSGSGFDLFIVLLERGWEETLALYPYLIGLILGIIILSSGFRAVGLTIIAGIFMIIGVLGVFLGVNADSQHGFNIHFTLGFFLVAAISLIYLILGPIIGKKFKGMANINATKIVIITLTFLFFLISLLYPPGARGDKIELSLPSLSIVLVIFLLLLAFAWWAYEHFSKKYPNKPLKKWSIILSIWTVIGALIFLIYLVLIAFFMPW